MKNFVKVWKTVYIVCIISLSVPGGSGTTNLGFFSGDRHLSLKFLREILFLSVWINQDQTKHKRPQTPISETKVHEQVRSKVGKVKDRGYIKSGYVKILIRRF